MNAASMMRLFAAWTAVALAVASTRAQTPDPEQAPPEQAVAAGALNPSSPGNTMCPVTTDEAVDENFSTVYNGRTVYFCCRRCRSKFEADPEAYVENLGAAVPVSLQTPDDPDVHGEEAPAQADAAEPDHDHAEDHGSGESFAVLPYLGRFHVLVIHFPIALLSIGALFEVAGCAGKRPRIEPVVRAAVGLGAFSALAAMLLGLANSIEAEYNGALSDVFWWHRALGIATTVVAVAAWVAVERRARSARPRAVSTASVLILLAALFVAVTGHLGGTLVFGLGYLLP